MSVYKKVTYAIAVGVAAIAAFFVTPAGQALVHQYPVLVPIAAGFGVLATLFHDPKAS
jgi:hypothetical protein